MPFLIILAVLGGAAVLFFVILGVCFFFAYYSPARPPRKDDDYPIPTGEVYDPFREIMISRIKETRAAPAEDFEITSFDGLTLRGKYYHYGNGAPIELMFPGYRGDAERDLCGGMQRCFELGHSALIVDQRACGRSDGSVISFGINESRDLDSWLEFMISHFGKDVRIIICGISMGAATVLLAAGRPLPKNVIGVLADCGYNSAEEIMKKVIKDIKLPVAPAFFLARLSGRLFGGFDVAAACPEKALENAVLPIIFIHGDNDRFVPHYMSEKNFSACKSERKKLITVDGAGHGLSYLVDKEKYISSLKEFFN